MTLAAGFRLGPYEVLSPVGAGGMGEVYRARDTRLERTVAVKVLPQHLSASAEVRQRFEREAKTISQLSHPHICALYDVGNQDGVEYLVMEYLEGETLADRLVRGALPLEQTLRYGIEIADALDKAHRQGIVHRDLKPGNVMLTKSGVKLLDFGLARAFSPVSAGASLSALPTQQKALTAEGTILGTLQYMAPEQLEGRETDPRTDIFALGATLYEAATGRKPFSGGSQASLISAILRDEPQPISQIAPMSPPALERAVKKCMAKDSEDRWQSAADLASELAWIADAGSRAGLPAPVAARRRSRDRVVTALAGALAGAIVVAFLIRAIPRSGGNERPPLVRFAIDYPPAASMVVEVTGGLAPSRQVSAWFPPIAISPDGRRVVTVRRSGQTQMLYLRELDELEDRPLPGSEGAVSPFFSPDGAWIGFQSQGKLRKEPIAGGPAVALCDAEYLEGASWSADGTIVFSPAASSALYRVSSDGGSPEPLTRLDSTRGENSHRFPQILPDGRHVLFTVTSGLSADRPWIAIAGMDTGAAQVLLKDADWARYVPPGYLLWMSRSELRASRFDIRRLRLEGQAVMLFDGLWEGGPFEVSASGTLLYLPEPPGAYDRTLVWVDRSGKETQWAEPPRSYNFPSFSPDGRFLAATFLTDSKGLQVWLLDLSRRVWSRFTLEGTNHFGVWTPDGKRLVFSSTRAGAANLYWQPADGSAPAEALVRSPHHQDPASCSPDGRFLAYAEIDPTTKWDIWILPLTGDRKPFAFRRTASNEVSPMFSPDGHWIAYASDESGRSEIYVERFPSPGARVQVSTDGGTDPAWSPAGGELFYRSEKKLMAVAYQADSEFRAGPPRALFEGPYHGPEGQGSPNYAVSRDGQRFLMIKEADIPLTRVVVALNLAEELKNRFEPSKR